MGTKMQQFADASMGRILSMERRLAGVLQPVNPRSEFVHGVARQIRTTPRVTLVDRLSNGHMTALLLALLISLAVLVALVGRALLSLLDRKHPAGA